MSQSKHSDDVGGRGCIELAAAGDRAAATACLERHGARVAALVERFGFTGEESERAVRSIFRRVWAQGARQRPAPADEDAFVVQVSRRWLLDRRARARMEGTPDGSPAPRTGTVPTTQADLFGPSARVARALASLDPDDRADLELSIVGAQPYARIAELRERPVAGLRDALRRALVRVGEALHSPAPPPLTPREPRSGKPRRSQRKRGPAVSASPELERLVGLLADRALEGLNPGRAAELSGLLASYQGLDEDALDRAAAQIDLALAPPGRNSLSVSLKRAVLADLDKALGAESPRARSAAPPRPRRDPSQPAPGRREPSQPESSRGERPAPARRDPSLAAAGRGDLAPALDLPASGPPPQASTDSQADSPVAAGRRHPALARRLDDAHLRSAVLAAGWVLAGVLVALWLGARMVGVGDPQAAIERASDRVVLAVKPGPGREEGSISGEIVWSGALQAGTARLEGLAPNDAAERRYQVWALEGEPAARALPAGLFDVPPEGGAVEVRLRPALPVESGVGFAITLEEPRGSLRSQSRLKKPIATAQP